MVCAKTTTYHAKRGMLFRMDTYTTHAQRIKHMRFERDISRAELAVMAGIGVGTIVKVEQEIHVGLGSLVRIYAVLRPDTTVAELV